MEKVADKVSQLVKRNSKEMLSLSESPLPPFKPIPKVQLQRESSLPRIEVERPATPLAELPPLKLKPSPSSDYSLGQIIPPNAKKLRVRSFLWVKPSTGNIDTSVYYQVSTWMPCSHQRSATRHLQKPTNNSGNFVESRKSIFCC